jgi:hypothetical protein
MSDDAPASGTTVAGIEAVGYEDLIADESQDYELPEVP